MRLIFFGAMVATLLAGCSFSDAPTTADALVKESKSPLATYVNQDLRELKDGPKAKLAKLLAATLPEKYGAKEPWGFEPWFVWRSESTRGKKGFIVFQGRHIVMIPGQSHAAVHFPAVILLTCLVIGLAIDDWFVRKALHESQTALNEERAYWKQLHDEERAYLKQLHDEAIRWMKESEEEMDKRMREHDTVIKQLEK